MTKRARLCLIVALAGQAAGLTATPVGLSVGQYPPSLTIMRGETATLCCHFKVESLKYQVQWFKMKPGKQLVPTSSRCIFVEKNHSSSLVITEVTLGDSGWYYCEVNVLQKDPERGNGTRLIVLAPPSAPKIFLQVPPNPQSDHWALICLTGGFHPSRVTLTWTYRSAAADVDHLPDASCTLPANSSRGSLPEPSADGARLSSARVVKSAAARQPRRLLMIDGHSLDVYLLNASPSKCITYLNILKLCFLSAVTVVFLLEAVKHARVQRQ